MSIFLQRKIGLVVCDMAGTIINENGIIYKTMYKTLRNADFMVDKSEIDAWAGKDKREVFKSIIYQSVRDYNVANKISMRLEEQLIQNLQKEYFESDNIKLINTDLLNFFDSLRINGVKVALNTGYPKVLQQKIIDHFNLEDHVDNYISSEEVSFGRPYPYMINNLMEKNLIPSSHNVAKIGDTKIDMQEGKNAHCGLTIGVLTGNENKTNLTEAGADIVIDSIMDLHNDLHCDFYL